MKIPRYASNRKSSSALLRLKEKSECPPPLLSPGSEVPTMFGHRSLCFNATRSSYEYVSAADTANVSDASTSIALLPAAMLRVLLAIVLAVSLCPLPTTAYALDEEFSAQATPLSASSAENALSSVSSTATDLESSATESSETSAVFADRAAVSNDDDDDYWSDDDDDYWPGDDDDDDVDDNTGSSSSTGSDSGGTSGNTSTTESDAYLDSVVAKLTGEGFSGWIPKLTYESDTNINQVLINHLKDLGVDTTGLTVTVSEVTFANTNPNAQVGISTNETDNGTITYYDGDPDEVGSWATPSLQRVNKIVFKLSHDGKTKEYSPARMFAVPWNTDAAKTLLESKAQVLSLAFAAGDTASSVTKDFPLPSKIPGVNWSTISWSSSSSAITVKPPLYGLGDGSAVVTRPNQDEQVVLEATISGLANFGMPEGVSVTRSFTVSVAGDSSAIEAEQQALQQRVDAAFTTGALKYSDSTAALNPESITDDMQLPRPRTLKVDGKQYSIAYQTSNDALTINGYRANVLRPEPGTPARSVDITLTVTSKKNPAISASKTLQLTIEPIDQADVQAELNLMAQAKAAYGNALAAGEDAAALTGNLHPFQKAYIAQDGSLTWAYTAADARGAGQGIVPVELPGYDSMGPSDQARLFASSSPATIANETLRLTRPDYDTEVTVSSVLSSEKYARYALRYPDNADFKALASQPVSAKFTVSGTKGHVLHLDVSCSIIGVDSFGADQQWVSETLLNVEQGTTAAQVTEQLLSATGLLHESQGAGDTGAGSDYCLSSITSPLTGHSLSWDQATGKYWQLFVNGLPSQVGAGAVVLHAGDRITWYYSAYGQSLNDEAHLQVSCSVIGPDETGRQVFWAPLSTVSLPSGATAADASEMMLTQAGLVHESQGAGPSYYLAKIVSPVTGEALSWNQETGRFWQLFINGKSASSGAGSIALAAGDKIEWIYSSANETIPDPHGSIGTVAVDPNAQGDPTLSSDWPTFAAHGPSMSGADTPTPDQSAHAIWTAHLKDANDWSTYASDPILVGDTVLIAVGSELQMRSVQTGDIIASTPLAAPIDSVARMTFKQGIVYVPLHGGRMQAIAVTSSSLMTKWYTEALPDVGGNAMQSLSNVTIANGCVYFAATAATWSASTGGWLVCLDAATGAVRWKQKSESAGYYWSGSTAVVSSLVVADDAGNLQSINAASGTVTSTLSLGAGVRSGVITDTDGRHVYAVSTDGVLHKVAIDSDGVLHADGSVSFAASSTSTPVLVGGKIYVGGAAHTTHATEWGSAPDGLLAVINAQTLTVEHAISSLEEGGAIGADVKSAPLVSTQDGQTYVYFTANTPPGGVYVYRLGDATARELFVPEADAQNYCLASPIAASDGSLYYVNDSGNLFKLVAAQKLFNPDNPNTPEKKVPVTPYNPGGLNNQTGTSIGNGLSYNDASSVRFTLRSNVLDSRATGSALEASEEQASSASTSSEAAASKLDTAASGTRTPSESLDGAVPVMLSEDAVDQVNQLPIWAVAGLVVGIAGLLILAFGRRRSKDEDK